VKNFFAKFQALEARVAQLEAQAKPKAKPRSTPKPKATTPKPRGKK